MIARVLVLASLLAAPLQAQNDSASALVSDAIRAYQDLEFDAAVRMLRRVLEPPLAHALGDAERARALSYLAAAEYYRERRDSTVAVFRRLIALAPGHRPDTLIFPPEITQLYADVRSSIPAPVQLSQVLAEPTAGSTVTVSTAGLVENVRTQSVAGTAIGFAGSVRFRRLALDVRYAEGDLVEGAALLRFVTTPWLSFQVGPHARRIATPFGAERWLTWRLGGRVDAAIVGTSVRGHATLWRALGLEVNVPPGSGSAQGGEVGITLDLVPRPFWVGLAYGIDRAQLRGASRRETVETLTLTAGLRRR